MAANMFVEVHSLLWQKRNQRKAEGIQHYQSKQHIFSSNQAVVNFWNYEKIVASFFKPVLFVQTCSDEFTHPFHYWTLEATHTQHYNLKTYLTSLPFTAL